MKKSLSILLALLIVCNLAACSGSSSNTETADTITSVETDATDAEEEPDKAEDVVEVESGGDDSSKDSSFSPLLNIVFVDLSSQIGLISYDECISYLDESSYSYDAAEPSYDALGVIVINDDNGFSLFIEFYPDDATGEYTMTFMSYTDGNFEGAVTDELHMSSVEYSIYDYVDYSSNGTVESVDDIISFFDDSVPSGLEAYEASVEENSEIDVTLDVTYKINNKCVYFTVKTNLPDESVLMLKLVSSDGDYNASTKVTIKDGSAVSEGFSNRGSQLKGSYTLTVSMSMAKLQPDSVATIIGSQGEFLTGQYVQSSEGGNYISGTFEVDF